MTQPRTAAAVRPGGRAVRLLLALLLAVAGALTATVGSTRPAYAADDRIDSFDIAYVLGADGVLGVTETIDWRFGSDSGRHGIQRDLVTREPYDDKQDAVYAISNVQVSSPDRGISTQLSQSTTKAQGGRETELNLRIGNPNQTVSAATATYVLSYDVSGALRTFPDAKPAYDELFWDALGVGLPLTNRISISAKVPGGAQEVSCFAGPVKSTTPCTSADDHDRSTATFTQTSLPAGQTMSIGVKITPGLIGDNAPHLERDGSALSPAQLAGVVGVGAAGLLSLVGSVLLGSRWWRRNGRDQRYAGLAPGTTPLPGQPVHIVPNDPDIPIPVAFSPPHIPVAEAGLLVDGQVDARETAATIIDLAVRGGLTVQSSGKHDFRVSLVDPDVANAPHEMVLLTALFGGQRPGATVDLSAQGSLLAPHQELQTSVRNQVAARGWFRKVPPASARSFGLGGLVLVVFLGFAVSPWLLLVAVPLLPVLVTVAVIQTKLKRGQRTPEGRAVCDQVEGFRTYLATAEADQLKFEEGEDIFSRYLPWAIVFELADRWAKICGDLVRMGRVPDSTPAWYYGSYNMSAFNMGFLTGSLTNAATPVPSTSGSGGTGFGGGSSFGGGGFSGGGGGGGGASSW